MLYLLYNVRIYIVYNILHNEAFKSSQINCRIIASLQMFGKIFVQMRSLLQVSVREHVQGYE